MAPRHRWSLGVPVSPSCPPVPPPGYGVPGHPRQKSSPRLSQARCNIKTGEGEDALPSTPQQREARCSRFRQHPVACRVPRAPAGLGGPSRRSGHRAAPAKSPPGLDPFSARILMESLLTQLPFIKYLSLYFYSCWKTYLAAIPTSVRLLKITEYPASPNTYGILTSTQSRETALNYPSLSEKQLFTLFQSTRASASHSLPSSPWLPQNLTPASLPLGWQAVRSQEEAAVPLALHHRGCGGEEQLLRAAHAVLEAAEQFGRDGWALR